MFLPLSFTFKVVLNGFVDIGAVLLSEEYEEEEGESDKGYREGEAPPIIDDHEGKSSV